MIRFARLIDGLVFTPSRNGKLRLIETYLAETHDPERGWVMAALTGCLNLPTAKPALIRQMILERTDPVLFGWSYDYVGDLAETVSLLWPSPPGINRPPPSVTDIVVGLEGAARAEVPALVAGWLDACTPDQRYALLKLLTGSLRIGISARLAKTALANWSGKPLDDIEELWHVVEPPYATLFAWMEGRADKPDTSSCATFRPLMLAHPLEDQDIRQLNAADYRAEWKWDGIRVQLAACNGQARMFSRTGDEIGKAFPDIIDGIDFTAVVDGELLVLRDEDGEKVVAPFNDMQQRLNRKTVSAKMVKEYPAYVRLYDLLFDGAEDLRGLPFEQRRARLESWFARTQPPRMDLSPMIPFSTWDELGALRADARANGIEGLMLKRADSIYVPGRPKGPWFKWKRDPLALDCVMMYAQRGHGKRSSYYSDFTFGAWRTDGDGLVELVPVGKAYSGYTDEELLLLDKWIRNHVVERFGPVLQVSFELVLEVVFDSIHRSSRHKSGVAMRFPRINRIRWDKPASEADYLHDVEKLIVE
jgi:DNA ligase-1